MKNAATVLSSLALIGVIVLFVMYFSGNKAGAGNNKPAAAGDGLKIAYVNIDSFEANFEYLKAKREEFRKKQERMRAELQNSEQQMQNDYASLQRRAQAGTLSQAEGEAAERRLMQMQQSLRTREQSLTEQLIKEQDDFNDGLHQSLDSFLVDYNKDKGYDYILTYGRAGQVMYANDAYNITADVIKGMNERSKERTAALNKSE